jgi:predicted transcriptional regulator
MTEQTIEFQRTLSTALCLIRDGEQSKTKLRAALDLSPVAMLDLVEELKSQGFILDLGDLIVITAEGRRAVSHLQLVKSRGYKFFERWAAPDPNGRQAA